MKKIYGILLIALLSLCLVFALSACGDEESTDSTVKKCLDDEHEFLAWEIVEEAYCNTLGLRSHTCGICGLVQQQKFKNTTNHNYVDNVCTYCGDSKAPDDVEFVLSDDETYYILNNVADKTATEYTIPARHEGLPVKAISAGAFKDCNHLEFNEIPNSIETIGEGAFAGCYGLKKMTIPFVGKDRGSDAPVFGYIFGKTTYPGSVGITQTIDGVKHDFWLPANLIEVTVTGGTLRDSCFENCTRLKRVTYEGEEEKIGNKAFSGCYMLDSVIFSEDVEEYGDRAFQNCTELDSFPLDGIIDIGEYCFAGCAITHLNIPNSLKYIGDGAFADCRLLTTVTVGTGAKRISDQMFQDCIELESVVIENGANSINKSAFYGCVKLTSITLPSSIEKIDETAFKDCTGLIEIEIPSSVKELGKGVFQNCTNLSQITMTEGIEEIGQYAFSNCESVVVIEIPASVKLIDENAFAGCDSLIGILVSPNSRHYAQIDGNIYTTDKTKLLLYSPGNDQESFVIPEGVVEIDPSAFLNAPFLQEVVFPSTITKIPKKLFYQNSTIKAIVINSGVEVIEKEAFAGCTALKTITINNTSIDEGAFTQCTVLETVTITNSIISKGAFHSCPALKDLTISGSSVIGENAFANCTSLVNLSISDIEVIATEAFSGCSSLVDLTIPSSVISLGEFAFSDCKKLKNIKFGANLANIGDACFRNCTSLEAVHITSSINSVTAYAFEGCTSLKSFTVSDANTSFKVFEGHLVDNSRNLIVFCPGLIEENTVIPEGITGIGSYVFRNAYKMKTVSFPSSLKHIGTESFYNSGLVEVNLNGINTLGKYSFGKCLALKEIHIPLSVTKIENYAFQDCIALSKIEIRSGVVDMGYAVFHITETLKTELGLEEIPKIKAYIEHKSLPETWDENWAAGGNVLQILGFYFG